MGDLRSSTIVTNNSSSFKSSGGKTGNTVTTVIQCHQPASFSGSNRTTSVDLACQSGSEFGRFRNSLKVLAGGVCRGLGGQSRPIRNLSRNRNRKLSSDSSSDDIKVVNSNDDNNANEEQNEKNKNGVKESTANDEKDENSLIEITNGGEKRYEPKDKGRPKKGSKQVSDIPTTPSLADKDQDDKEELAVPEISNGHEEKTTENQNNSDKTNSGLENEEEKEES